VFVSFNQGKFFHSNSLNKEYIWLDSFYIILKFSINNTAMYGKILYNITNCDSKSEFIVNHTNFKEISNKLKRMEDEGIKSYVSYSMFLFKSY